MTSAGLRYHNRNYYAQHGWPKLAAFLAAAAILWLLSSNHQDEIIPGSIPRSTKRPFLSERDSLFWIPARYWPAVSCALGVLFYFIRG